jgi:hypothetical protein
MIKYTRFLLTLLFSAVIVFAANAQSTTSSPYSRFGLGDIEPTINSSKLRYRWYWCCYQQDQLFNNINFLNPASYGAISLTTIDVGIYSNFSTLSQTGQTSQSNKNFRLSHIAFGIPVSKHSAFSFGLLPYSERGYSYKKSVSTWVHRHLSDTNVTNYSYNGDGGLSKAYIGYGFTIGKHLLIGANVSYIFGNLKDNTTTETPGLAGFLNTKIEQTNAIGGLNYDYGVQYSFDFSETKHLIWATQHRPGQSLTRKAALL